MNEALWCVGIVVEGLLTERLAPAALHSVGGRNYHRFVVRLAGVIVDRSGGLGAEISGFGVEVQRADTVGTVGAGELHSALDALDSVGFHWLDCSLRFGKD